MLMLLEVPVSLTLWSLLLIHLAPALAQQAGALEGGGVALPEEEQGPPLALGEEADPIINGEEADGDLFPNTGGLLVNLDDAATAGITLMCSSTLIAPDVVLIAAHCVDPIALGCSYDDCVAEVGWSRQADLSAYTSVGESWPSDAVLATDWVMHDQWDITSLGYGLAENNDIALVFLSEAVTDVEPAYLPTEYEAEDIEEGDEVSIVGWGYQDADLTEGLGVKMWGKSDISRIATFEMQIGAAMEAVRKCHGDSGGPTFRAWPDSSATVKERLIGVTSHTYDETDCQETGGVDTRVDFFRTWIDAQMISRCKDGSRVWCETEGILPPPVVPKTNAEMVEDVHLVGCATGGAGARGVLAVALGALALAGRRYRPVPKTR